MRDYREFLREHSILLAPMAGVSDPAMRQLCIEQGARLTFTEMVSAKGLSYANKKTSELLDLAACEDVVGVQLFGHEPKTMAQQACWVAEHLGDALAVIDINMGCPARKIVTKGDGSSLMERPAEAYEIVRETVAAVDVPVTVKMRRGYANGCETAPELARMMEDAGAAAVTVHGRYAQQMYRGTADWGVIARVHDAVSIPVVGNGDIVSGDDAVCMRKQTGCEAVMVARGAQGNPWVFADIAAACAGEPRPTAPSASERVEMARRHAHLLHEREPRSVVRMRKHASWYCKGLPGASAARGAFNSCTTVEDFDLAFDQLEARWESAGTETGEARGEIRA
jgi:nifR3 family TIM-barrel protein